MRGMVVVGVAAAVAGAIALAPRMRGETWKDWLGKLMWSTAGIPSGPLGWLSARSMPRDHAPFYRLAAEALELRPDDELLEVGCGSGAFLDWHAAYVGYVAGLDASDIQVGLAQQRLAQRIAAGTAEIVKGDAASLPWDDGRFSIVTAIEALELFAEPQSALAEMYRVLRPGGRGVFTMGFRLDAAKATGRRGAAGQWAWGEADARRLVEEAGFTDVSVTYERKAGGNRVEDMIEQTFAVSREVRLVHGVKAR
jgi:SAM-dependent methyltransferase